MKNWCARLIDVKNLEQRGSHPSERIRKIANAIYGNHPVFVAQIAPETSEEIPKRPRPDDPARPLRKTAKQNNHHLTASHGAPARLWDVKVVDEDVDFCLPRVVAWNREPRDEVIRGPLSE